MVALRQGRGRDPRRLCRHRSAGAARHQCLLLLHLRLYRLALGGGARLEVLINEGGLPRRSWSTRATGLYC